MAALPDNGQFFNNSNYSEVKLTSNSTKNYKLSSIRLSLGVQIQTISDPHGGRYR
jgi:hypothetical protein